MAKPKKPERHDLRRAVEEMVVAEVARVGPDDVDQAAIVRRFTGKGAGDSTLYRWIKAAIPAGTKLLAGDIKQRAAKARAKAGGDERKAATAIAAGGALSLPPIVSMDDIATSGLIPVMDLIRKCISMADTIMNEARAPDGTIKLKKTGLAASEHMRRNLETALKIQESIERTEGAERFNRLVLEEIAKESPETAERIVTRLRQLAMAHAQAESR